jgi:hypothetical protein
MSTYKINGQNVTREEFVSYKPQQIASSRCPPPSIIRSNKLGRSEVIACNSPEEVEIANEALRKHHVGAYIDPKPEPGRRHGGQLVFNSANQRAEAIRVLAPMLGLHGTLHDDYDVFTK